MSEGNQGASGQRRPPVIEDDDRPTAEIPVVPSGGDGGERPGSGSPARPAGAAPSGDAKRQGANPGQAAGQPAGAQPSASGWTPPPLGGRQTPQPPAAKPTTPRPASGPARPTTAPSGVTPPAVRPSAGPRPAPSQPAAPAAPTAAAPTPASDSSATSPSGSAAKLPFWHKVTDALGIDRKSGSGAAAESKNKAPELTVGPTAAAEATTVQPKPSAGGNARAGVPAPTHPAPTHPGPQQYRVGNQPQAPAAPVRPGAAASAGTVGATALQPTATAGQGPRAGETQAAGAKPPARRTRKARLRLSRLDPWSVMKTSFLFAIAAGIMLVVAVYAIWVVLSASGLFASINDIVASVVSTPGDTTPFQIQDYLDTQRVMGIAALIACVDVVIFTALATLASFLYNLAATMLGGLEVTLAED